MTIQRLTTEKQRKAIKDSKKFKDKDSSKLTRQELDELIVILAKKE